MNDALKDKREYFQEGKSISMHQKFWEALRHIWKGSILLRIPPVKGDLVQVKIFLLPSSPCFYSVLPKNSIYFLRPCKSRIFIKVIFQLKIYSHFDVHLILYILCGLCNRLPFLSLGHRSLIIWKVPGGQYLYLEWRC